MWEDGTGADSSELSESRGIIDYYYVQDEAEDVAPGDEEVGEESSLRLGQEQEAEMMMAGDGHRTDATVDSDRFPREWFQPRHALVKEESIRDEEEEEEEEQYGYSAGEQPPQQLITVSSCTSSLTQRLSRAHLS